MHASPMFQSLQRPLMRYPSTHRVCDAHLYPNKFSDIPLKLDTDCPNRAHPQFPCPDFEFNFQEERKHPRGFNDVHVQFISASKDNNTNANNPQPKTEIRNSASNTLQNAVQNILQTEQNTMYQTEGVDFMNIKLGTDVTETKQIDSTLERQRIKETVMGLSSWFINDMKSPLVIGEMSYELCDEKSAQFSMPGSLFLRAMPA